MNEFLSFVAGVMDVPAGSLSPETAYGSLPEWDSVMHLRLVLEVSERYALDIPLERVPDLKTLADFYRFVRP